MPCGNSVPAINDEVMCDLFAFLPRAEARNVNEILQIEYERHRTHQTYSAL
jgi:hypothetical protein